MQCAIHHPRRQFTLKTGTIFEDSPIGRDKWLCAMWQVVNSKNRVSSNKVHRAMGITQKTAWFMDHRIRLALGIGSPDKLCGEVEADETFIGGKARSMHIAQLKRRITGTGGKDKAKVKNHFEGGSALYTDSLLSDNWLEADYAHQVINDAIRYVDGRFHSNGIENFWSLLNAVLLETYVSVDPFHLFRYLDEQSFRFNNRKASDAERFTLPCLAL